MNENKGTRNSTIGNEMLNLSVYQRIIYFWAFVEGGLGGIMHLLHIPLTGFVIGAFSIIINVLLAKYSFYKVSMMGQALLIVLMAKFALSPHSPIGAYVAVAFQGLLAMCIFPLFKINSLTIWIYAVLTMLESAFQKPIMAFIIFGKELWQGIVLLINQFFNDTTFVYQSLYVLIALYIIIYVTWASIISIWTNRIAKNIDFFIAEQKLMLMQQKFGEKEKNFERMEKNFGQMKRTRELVEKKFSEMKRNFGQMKKNFGRMAKNFERMKRTRGLVEQKFSEMKRNFGQMEKNFEAMEKTSIEKNENVKPSNKNNKLAYSLLMLVLLCSISVLAIFYEKNNIVIYLMKVLAMMFILVVVVPYIFKLLYKNYLSKKQTHLTEIIEIIPTLKNNTLIAYNITKEMSFLKRMKQFMMLSIYLNILKE